MPALLESSNIGRRLDIFERQIGAPDDAGADWAAYTVDGCPVRVTTKDNVVTWIEIRIAGENCEVPLKPLLGADRVVSTSAPLTFAQFDSIAGGRTFYSHPCAGLDCGNALEPYLIVVNPGAHVDNFIDVEATASNYDDDLYFAWKDAVTAKSGEEYFGGDLECDRQYDDLSRAMLATVKVDAIAFGHRFQRPDCR